MKLLLAITFGAFITLGLSSCAKETCYTCENTVATITCTVDICDATVETSGSCTGLSVSSSGANNEDLKEAYEAAGYTCTAK
ncbi:MAG: hypothetical protein ACRBFS_22015 [Aureispira sp.]